MSTVLNLGQINLPRHEDKHQLVAPMERAERAQAWLLEELLDWCGVVELWSPHMPILSRPPQARIRMARPNNLLRRGQTLGNGQWWDREALKRKGLPRSFKVPMPGRPRGLNMPQLGFQVRNGGERFDAITIHAPRMKEDPRTNRLVIDTAMERAHDLHDKGRTVILSGDLNDGTAWRELERNGFDVGIHHGVDVIAGLGVTDWPAGKVHSRGVDGVWTDHPALTVSAVLSRT